MKPIFISHESYQDFVLTQLQKHYSGGILTLVNKDWPIIAKLWITDISYITTWLNDSYSVKGPLPRDPASMLRSYLLFLLTNPTIGITKWVDELHRVPLYAILSGFEPGDIPGVGTFYDFFGRLWGMDFDNVRPKLKRKRKSKRKKKPKKGEKQDLKNPGIIKKLVNRFLRDGAKKKVLPADRLFEFFQSQILSVSAKLGLLGNHESLSVAGDGTPLVTVSFPIPKTPRSSEKWKLVYKRRSSIERSNKRQKVEYKLEAGRHRSTKMWYIRVYCIMMCQHIDAWYSVKKDTLKLAEVIF